MLLNKFNRDKAILKVKDKNNRSKNIKIASIVLSIMLLTGAIIYFSFARYETGSTYTLINGTVDEFGDNIISAFVDGNRVSNLPSPSDNVSFSSITCNNDASATFDIGSWSAIINTTKSNTRCSVNFVTNNNAWQLPGGVDLYDGMTPIKFTMPTDKEREDIIRKNLETYPLKMNVSLKKLVKLSKGMSGRDIKEKLLKTSLHNAISEDKDTVNLEDIQYALKSLKVNHNEVKNMFM